MKENFLARGFMCPLLYPAMLMRNLRANIQWFSSTFVQAIELHCFMKENPLVREFISPLISCHADAKPRTKISSDFYLPLYSQLHCIIASWRRIFLRESWVSSYILPWCWCEAWDGLPCFLVTKSLEKPWCKVILRSSDQLEFGSQKLDAVPRLFKPTMVCSPSPVKPLHIPVLFESSNLNSTRLMYISDYYIPFTINWIATWRRIFFREKPCILLWSAMLRNFR